MFIILHWVSMYFVFLLFTILKSKSNYLSLYLMSKHKAQKKITRDHVKVRKPYYGHMKQERADQECSGIKRR